MKKKLISLALVAGLLCSFAGLAYADNIKDLYAQSDVTVETDTRIPEVFIPGSVPAQSAAMEGMIPPVNALVLCMLEHGLSYDEDSELFLWNSVYYMISLYGQMDSRAELTDDELILPAETVEDYAAALFTNYRGLPQLPEGMKDRVTYDPNADTYHLARGDAGLSEIVLTDAHNQADGSVFVSGAMVALEDGSEMCSFTAELTANNSMFGYSISGLDIM